MSVREYIGARYVPLFADPLDWDSTKTYEPLTIVYHQGNSFTSRQYVPAGIDITNESYWAVTGNYNAQVEAYRQEVRSFDSRITNNTSAIQDEATARENADTALQQSIQDEATARENADNALQQSIQDEATARENADNEIRRNVFPEFAIHCVDRYPISETANSYNSTGAQAACVFSSNGIRYGAYCLNVNANAGIDTIRIRNIDANSLVTDIPLNAPYAHGLAIDYLEDTQELLYYNEESRQVYIYSMANIANPSLRESVRVTNEFVGYAVCWKNENEFITMQQNILQIRNRSDFSIKETHALELNDYSQSSIYQDIDYNAENDYLVILNSFPEHVVMIDFKTFKQINVFNIPQYSSFINIQEAEGVSISDDSIYIITIAPLATLHMVTTFEWNYKEGTQKTDDSIHKWNDTSTIGTLIVDYNNGNAIDPINDNARTFKYFDDAVNFARNNYPDYLPLINLQSDYPYVMRNEGSNLELRLNTFKINGLDLRYGIYRVTASEGCTTNASLTFRHVFARLVGVHNVQRTAENFALFNFSECNVQVNGQLNYVTSSYMTLLVPNSASTPQNNYSTPFAVKLIVGSNTWS